MIEIIANIISFIGNTLFTSSALFKKKKVIVTLQNCNHVLSIISEAMQAAYSGIVQEAVSLLRNLILLFVKNDQKILKIIISIILVLISTIVGIVINIRFSNGIWYGYFPIFGTISYSTCLLLGFMFDKDAKLCEILIKFGLILNAIFWIIYGLMVRLYPISIFNSITLVLSLYSIIKILIDFKKIKNNENM